MLTHRLQAPPQYNTYEERLLYGPHGQRLHSEYWLFRSKNMLEERRRLIKRAEYEKECIAMGHFLSNMFERWRRRVQLRVTLKTILRKSIIRWAIAIWRTTCKLHNLLRTINRWYLRLMLSKWKALKEMESIKTKVSSMYLLFVCATLVIIKRSGIRLANKRHICTHI